MQSPSPILPWYVFVPLSRKCHTLERPFPRGDSDCIVPWGIVHFVHSSLTLLMTKILPTELWFRITDFIPDDIIFKLAPINDLFYDVALDRRHRALTLDSPYPYELNHRISCIVWVFFCFLLDRFTCRHLCVFFLKG